MALPIRYQSHRRRDGHTEYQPTRIPWRVELHDRAHRLGNVAFIYRQTLSVLSRQCLDRRIPNKQALIEEVSAWEQDRNNNHTKADWQFTTADARIKLKRLYPAI